MRCAHCNAECPRRFRFCGQCGSPLGARAAAGTAPRQGERRQITVMFCDLVGSVALSESLDPEDFRELLDRYQSVAAAAVQRHDGRLAQFLGDGILAYFGYPRAHEDDASRAVRAGLEMLAAIAALNSRLQRDKGLKLAARIGIHTGLVVAGEMGSGHLREQLAVGKTPNVAARVQSMAGPGGLLISAATHRLVRGYFTCESFGVHGLKGVTTPMELYRVLDETGAQGRLEAMATSDLTPLVGRDPELAQLLDHWSTACAGKGRMVVLRGEPGIGKSRLIETFAGKAGADVARLRYFCSEHHVNSPLYPVARQLEHAAGFGRTDTDATRFAKLEALLAPVSPAPEELALLAELLALPEAFVKPLAALGLSPQRKREMTFSLLLRIVEVFSSREPLLLVFEDAHWADPTSLELIDRLTGLLDRVTALAIVTLRPGFPAPWVRSPNAATLDLGRLDEAQRRQFVSKVAAGADLPEEAIDEIIGRSDGVPLFIEELTRATLEAGASATGVPVTLQTSLQARLDHLGVMAKEVAQVGAAIGRQFSFQLLAAISRRSPQKLASALDALDEAAILARRGSPPEATYSFRHALVQDAAYATLLNRRRRTLHAAIARELEAHGTRDAASHELLAHHLASAGKPREAIRAWRAAARHSVERGAFAEAQAQLRAGISLLEQLRDDADSAHLETTLQNGLGNVLIACHGYTSRETLAAFERARALAAKLDDSGQGLRALWGLGTALLFEGRLGAVLKMMDEAAPLVEKNGHLDGRLAFSVVHASVLFEMGRLAEAYRQLEITLAMDDEPGRDRERAILYGQSPRISALGHLSIASLLMGRPGKSLEQANQCIREAEGLRHKPMLCVAHSLACRRTWLAGDARALAHHAGELQRLATDQATLLWLALARIYSGWSLAEAGAVEEGIERTREGMRLYEDCGARSGRPLMLLALGRACIRAGRIDEAREALSEALRGGTTGEERWAEPEVLNELGDIRYRSADATGAMEAWRNAVCAAGASGARLFESRARTRLERNQPEIAERGTP